MFTPFGSPHSHGWLDVRAASAHLGMSSSGAQRRHSARQPISASPSVCSLPRRLICSFCTAKLGRIDLIRRRGAGRRDGWRADKREDGEGGHSVCLSSIPGIPQSPPLPAPSFWLSPENSNCCLCEWCYGHPQRHPPPSAALCRHSHFCIRPSVCFFVLPVSSTDLNIGQPPNCWQGLLFFSPSMNCRHFPL